MLTDNPKTDCAYYSGTGLTAVDSHTAEAQSTSLVDTNGNTYNVDLKSHEMIWLKS